MAHGLTDTDSLYSFHRVPWHGLGAVLERRPVSVAEALTLSGLSWQVLQRPLHVALGDEPDALAPLEAWRANVRSDTGTVLGIVTEDYRVVQNSQAFAFLAGLIGSECHWETAGSLWGGRQLWALCVLPDHIEVGGDELRQYMLVTTRHDGAGAVTVKPTEVRVVCNNTLRAALRDTADVYRVRDLGDPTAALHQARAALRVTIDYGSQFKVLGDRLASQSVTEQALTRVLRELYPADTELGGRALASRARAREKIVDLFLHGETRGNAPGSKWCAWNAVVEHHDHHSNARSSQGIFLRRVEDPTGLKRRALDLIAAA
jgi:phage/plasmid-like protein (TIGR03299 family)